MQYPLLSISLALALGVAVGVIIQNGLVTSSVSTADNTADPIVRNGDPGSETVPEDNPDRGNQTELSRRLYREIKAREALEKKLAELDRKIIDLERSALLPAAKNLAAEDQEQDESGLPGSEKQWFNEQALIASGMSESQARELKLSFQQLELERLYLRDQSIREDWDRDRYREALQALTDKEEELKNQLSESEYDSYLYASGQTNRVAVTSVLESAPAATAGIEPGDHIIRYDNQRIYSWRDLRDATSTGTIGTLVPVEVERDGRTLDFYLARGPLGIRMNSLSIAP